MFSTHTYPKTVLGSSGSHLYPRKVRTIAQILESWRLTFVRHIGFHGGLGMIVGPHSQAFSPMLHLWLWLGGSWEAQKE